MADVQNRAHGDGWGSYSDEDLGESAAAALSSFGELGTGKAAGRGKGRRLLTKLDVLSRDEMQKLWRRQIALAVLLLAGAVAQVLVVQLLFASELDVPVGDVVLHLRVYQTSPYGLYVYSILVVCVFAFACVLFLTYAQRILLHSHAKLRSHEQLWGMLRNGALLFYIDPVPYIMYIIGYLATGGNLGDPSNGDKQMIALGMVFRNSMFVAGTYLYFWTSAHSFRIRTGPLPRMFYVPKLGLLLLYIFSGQLLFWRQNVAVAEVPFVSIAYLIRICARYSIWRRDVVSAVVLHTVLELCVVLWVARDVLLTSWDVAAEEREVEFDAGDSHERSQRARSWHFFATHHALVYTSYYIAYCVLLFGLPVGPAIAAAKMWSFFSLWLSPMPVVLLVYWLGYAVVESFVNLPPDSSGLKGWFVPNTISR